MGMFDEVRIRYQLPWSEVQREIWQSKETPTQFGDQYEIREDGRLWHEAYDMRFEDDPEELLGVWIHKDNVRWEQEVWNGQIECHTGFEHPEPSYSVRFWFRDGVVADMICEKT